MSRSILRISPAQATSDGAGVRLLRALGTAAMPVAGPFLMLDEFRSDKPGDYLAGFPMHPHRGFETVTIMLAGAMRHRDSVGNTGHLRAGSVQWMTAGRGIVHEEMPEQEAGLMWGFQLWVNLPAHAKMMAPRYQDIAAERIPTVTVGDASVRVVAGEVAGVRGPVEGIVTEPILLDVTVAPGGSVRLPFPAAKEGFVYLTQGGISIGGRAMPARHIASLGAGEGLDVVAGPEGARFLLAAGNPIAEPVARYGPFVMNTEQELRQAIMDYQSGKLGT
jgi:redox-sensitive bicupin YhaK (pirin superfamily)